eukprot:TRINITY_DN13416_c0_g1_i1.p1 TRINITY_DN13416_c0_g1~~TRINITY_DN13416_c0_g1_i1.p1  ORF type:complete len:214 (-),score=38.05 TRINITY_DN13416_c0_g1_i1:120-761(-)
MSKYLSSSHSPVVFVNSVVDIIHSIEYVTDVRRSVPVPRTGDLFVYNKTLYSKLLSTLTNLDNNIINNRPAVIAQTDVMKSLLDPIVERNELEWGLVYSKEERKKNGKNCKEVSLSNVKRFIADIVVDNINLEIDSLEEYLNFVEAETKFLEDVQDALTPETTNSPKKGSSTITSKPVDKSELERFKGIAEKMRMRLLQQSSAKKEVDPDDLW